jgi:SAM-dependent methyltransferase
MPDPIDINQPEFWEEIYQGGRAGWDLGGPTPVLRRLLGDLRSSLAGSWQDRGELAPGRLIVLGAGRGHDAREFAWHGFKVTAVDFAADAAAAMRRLADPLAPIEIVQADIFTLPAELDQTFDAVLEYTCFCAINPARRPEYADLVARLIRPGGAYVALLFPLDQHKGGPPFAVSVDEALSLFQARGFQLLRRETPDDSVPQRRGLEQLLIWQAPQR